jgi:hypothetical protein
VVVMPVMMVLLHNQVLALAVAPLAVPVPQLSRQPWHIAQQFLLCHDCLEGGLRGSFIKDADEQVTSNQFTCDARRRCCAIKRRAA